MTNKDTKSFEETLKIACRVAGELSKSHLKNEKIELNIAITKSCKKILRISNNEAILRKKGIFLMFSTLALNFFRGRGFGATAQILSLSSERKQVTHDLSSLTKRFSEKLPSNYAQKNLVHSSTFTHTKVNTITQPTLQESDDAQDKTKSHPKH